MKSLEDILHANNPQPERGITKWQAKRVKDETAFNGGSTLTTTGSTARYVVGNGQAGIVLSAGVFVSMLTPAVRDLLNTLNLDEADGLGTWIDKTQVFIDPINRIDDIEEAYNLAKARGERAFWDSRLGVVLNVEDLDGVFDLTLPL